MFNSYTRKARLYPTIISAIPILLFQYAYLNKELSDFLVFLGKIEILGDITISVVVLYFVSQINRFVSKTFFEKEEIYMPTTTFLLIEDNEYSKEYKRKIYDKLEKDFELKLPSVSKQRNDEVDSRKIISEVMSLARKRVGKGKLLLQHNIEYGFWRNLSGGSILALLFSLIILYLSIVKGKSSVLIAAIILATIFVIILVFNQFFINRVGKLYARVLIQEYMADVD